MTLDTVHTLSRRTVGGVLAAGMTAIDATVGNGHDTLFLAQQVGPTGIVFGFDIQDTALAAARRRLGEREHELAGVTFFLAGHEAMARHIPQAHHGRVNAILFNLGYLPGSDKRTITATETTLAALDQSLDLLAPGGVLSVVIYPGHVGGDVESVAVDRWAAQLPGRGWRAATYRPLTKKGDSPWLLLATKGEDEHPLAGR